MYNEVSKVITPVYQVGGSVRDEILGIKPKDYDFTTPLSPDEIESKVRAANRRPYLIGKKFGTIGFKAQNEKGEYELVEVTTFRREEYETGSRKPKVEFVDDLKDDLSRRDFTFNAIAKQGETLIDPFGGRLDIMQKRIKCVGTPKDRFMEDPLRMLRMARFAAQLGFEADQLAISTAGRMAETILYVSRERWVMELDKLLVQHNPWLGFSILMQTGLLSFILPEYMAIKSELGAESMLAVRQAAKTPEARWAALLGNTGKHYVQRTKKDKTTYPHHELLAEQIAIKTGLYLKWSNDRIEEVSKRVRAQNFN